jgi:hypothetical protein
MTTLIAAFAGYAMAFTVADGADGRAVSSARPGAEIRVAAAAKWPAKKTAKRRASSRSEDESEASSESTQDLEAEVLGPPPKGNRKSTSGSTRDREEDDSRPRQRRRADAEDEEDEEDEDSVAAGDEDVPKVRRRSSRRDEEEEDEEEEESEPRVPSLPVVAPHLVSFNLGGAVMGRSFRFDTPTLQGESTLARAGFLLALEAFPLLLTEGWFAYFGLGVSYGREMGSAAAAQPDGGSLSYPVSESRWSADLRYAFQLGTRVMLIPSLGYGRSSYDLQRREPIVPSMCTRESMTVCIPDVNLSFFKVGFDLRVAIRPMFALFLNGAFLPGKTVGAAMGAIGSQARVSTLGYSAEVGVTWQLKDWLAVRGSIPITRYHYAFIGQSVGYTSATEMYYGAIVGPVVFTK